MGNIIVVGELGHAKRLVDRWAATLGRLDSNIVERDRDGLGYALEVCTLQAADLARSRTQTIREVLFLGNTYVVVAELCWEWVDLGSNAVHS